MVASVTKTPPLHKKSFSAAVLVGTIFAILPLSLVLLRQVASPRIRGAATDLSPTEVIAATNDLRQSHGLAPLQPQLELMKAAEAKAQVMIAANTWSHNTPTATPWQFIQSEGYIYSLAGENLAKGFDSSAAVVAAWYDSPSHRANLLNPDYTDIGVAVMEAPYQNQTSTTLVVQFLAKAYNPLQDEVPNGTMFQLPVLMQSVSATSLFYCAIDGIGIPAVVSLIYLGWLYLSRISTRRRPPSLSYWRH